MQIQDQPETIFDNYELPETKKSYPNLLQAWLWIPVVLIINVSFAIILGLMCSFFWKAAATSLVINFSLITVCSEITFLLFSYYFMKLRSEPDYRPSFRLPALPVVLILIVITPAFYIILQAFSEILPFEMPQYAINYLKSTLQYPLVYIGIIMIFSSVVEEVIFRGVLLDGLLKNRNTFSAILQSSLIIGIMYMSPAIAIPNFLTAIFMGWLYYHLRSVSGGILTRMLFNLTALVIFQYSNGDQFLSIAPLCHNSLDYKLIVAAMTLIFAAGIIYLQYYFTRHTALSNKTIN